MPRDIHCPGGLLTVWVFLFAGLSMIVGLSVCASWAAKRCTRLCFGDIVRDPGVSCELVKSSLGK